MISSALPVNEKPKTAKTRLSDKVIVVIKADHAEDDIILCEFWSMAVVRNAW